MEGQAAEPPVQGAPAVWLVLVVLAAVRVQAAPAVQRVRQELAAAEGMLALAVLVVPRAWVAAVVLVGQVAQ